MSILTLNQYNIYQLLKEQASANGSNNMLDFSAFASIFNSEAIKEQLDNGNTKDSILTQLLNFAGINTGNTELINLLSDDFSQIIEEVENIYSEEKVLEDTNTNENTNENGNDSFSPKAIADTTEDWKIENTGNIFNENISKVDFLKNLDELKNTSEENEYLKAIEELGSENFFNTLDKNNDGILDKSELDALINADEDGTGISAIEFNNIINLNSQPEDPQLLIEDPQPQTDVPLTEETQKLEESKSSEKKHHKHSSDGDSEEIKNDDTKETLDGLNKQKEEIISKADSEINELKGQIDELINNASLDNELKTNYENAKIAYDDNQNAIKENDEKIEEYNTNIHKIDTSIAALEGELSTLDTNTDDAEINAKNTARKAEIETQLETLKEEKSRIEGEKTTLENNNSELKGNEPELKNALDEAIAAIQAGLPDEIKQQIEELKSQIEGIEADKKSKVEEIDSKIETLKAQEIEDSKKSGEIVGKLSSNPIGARLVETALKYNGEKGGERFSTGDYGWCADFVTYVVKEVAKDMGRSDEEVKEIRKHLGASPQKLSNRNEGHVIETSGMSVNELQNVIQPGMAFICKGGGKSGQHTGFIAEVYDDGTFLSIEGNHGNKVCQVRRNISDMYRFVDFSYLLT